MSNGSEKDYENMSDEDFANQSSPDPVTSEVEVEAPVEPVVETEAAVEPVVAETPAEEDDQTDEEITSLGSPEEATAPAETPAITETPVVPEEAKEVDYKSAYEAVMAPFKANGREFKPESPEEAIRLMQMGANYAKKMEALKPSLKSLRMLDNNGLLSEDKISYLIDLSKKDPGAIQKLLKEANIDPLDLDTSSESTYQPGVHTVSDSEMAFHDTLTEVASTPEGKDTVSHINTHWDKVSKEQIYKEPVLLRIMNEQRANGIYDQITAQIERMKVFGNLDPSIPFIEAYRQAGDYLQQQGQLTPVNATAAPVHQSQVLETRTVARKQTLPNGDKAKAASSVKPSAKVASKEFDPFSMTDAEIMALDSPRG